MHQPDDDEKLLRDLRRGSVEAFEEIYQKFKNKIYILSFRYLKNKEDAEGIVQEVFVQLWQNRARLRKDSNLNAWLFTITFNLIRKRFRDLSREVHHLKEYASQLEAADQEISDPNYDELLEKANYLIEKLPPQQKRVLLLRKEKGHTSSEIADLLHISKKTVENHLNRARVYLRKVLEEQGLLGLLLLFWLFIY